MASTTGDFTVAATPGDQVPYALVGPDGEPVEPVQDYLAELLAADCSPLTLRSYAWSTVAATGAWPLNTAVPAACTPGPGQAHRPAADAAGDQRPGV
jgi:hypothetical protein